MSDFNKENNCGNKGVELRMEQRAGYVEKYIEYREAEISQRLGAEVMNKLNEEPKVQYVSYEGQSVMDIKASLDRLETAYGLQCRMIEELRADLIKERNDRLESEQALRREIKELKHKFEFQQMKSEQERTELMLLKRSVGAYVVTNNGNTFVAGDGSGDRLNLLSELEVTSGNLNEPRLVIDTMSAVELSAHIDSLAPSLGDLL